MKPGSITMSQNPKGKVWSGNTQDRHRGRNSSLKLPRKKWCYCFFETQKGLYWKTTWKRGVRSAVQDTVICWPTIWNKQFTPNAEAYCRRKCCCCMTMHAHTRPATLSKPLIIWVSRCWNTLPTVQISPLPTTISLDHSKMHYEVVDFLRKKMRGA